MASIPCTIQLSARTATSRRTSPGEDAATGGRGTAARLAAAVAPERGGASEQERAGGAHVLVQYFNYMGMLAVEGTYDKMEALLSQDIHPVDILFRPGPAPPPQPAEDDDNDFVLVGPVGDVHVLMALSQPHQDRFRPLVYNTSLY
ncbi:hypothetical protein EJB05_16050, partial [Eragrostis curvula]